MDSVKQSPEWIAANSSYFHSAAEMIGHEKAIIWFGSFCNYILALDHIEDRDPMAGVEAEALKERFFDWESDPFWTQARQQLLPVCFSAYISWKVGTSLGNRDAQTSVYFTIPCAIAYLLHGRKHVEERAEKLFKEVQKFQKTDDQ